EAPHGGPVLLRRDTHQIETPALRNEDPESHGASLGHATPAPSSRARGPPQRGACASRRSSTTPAPRLLSGLLPLPHLGDCTHDGQPSRHGHEATASRVARTQEVAAA